MAGRQEHPLAQFGGDPSWPSGRPVRSPDPALAGLLGLGPYLLLAPPQRRRVARGMGFLADRSRRRAAPHFHVAPARFRRTG